MTSTTPRPTRLRRALEDVRIVRLCFIDPSDGGDVYRDSVSLEWRGADEGGSWRLQSWALDCRMDLYSCSFTYFPADPANGDQFR